MASGPKLNFICDDIGLYLVVSRSSSAATKTEEVLRIPLTRFSSRFSRCRRPKLSFYRFAIRRFAVISCLGVVAVPRPQLVVRHSKELTDLRLDALQ